MCRHRQKKRKPKGKRARQAAFFKAQRETKKHQQEERKRVQEKPKKRKKLNLDEEENEDFGIRFLVQEEKRAQKEDQKHFESIPTIPNDQNFEMIDEYQYKTTSKTLILPLRHGLLPRGGGPLALPSRDEWIRDFRARFEDANESSDKQSRKGRSEKFRPMTRRKQNNGSVVLARKSFSLFDTL